MRRTWPGCRTEGDRTGVVRNGYLPERKLQTGIGPVTVKIPKVRSKTGELFTFRSARVPPYVRKTANVLNCLPKPGQAKAKQRLHDIWQAVTLD